MIVLSCCVDVQVIYPVGRLICGSSPIQDTTTVKFAENFTVNVKLLYLTDYSVPDEFWRNNYSRLWLPNNNSDKIVPSGRVALETKVKTEVVIVLQE